MTTQHTAGRASLTMRAGAWILASSLLLGACTTEQESPSSTPEATTAEASDSDDASEQEPGTVETIAEGLEAPWSIAFQGETPLVSERDSARIVELDDAGGTREVAVIDGVSPGGEGGLLGITVHDDHLYAYYTTSTDNRIGRFPIQGEPGDLALGSEETILAGIPAARTHNGGRIAFGPDGMLYATTGDAGNPDSAQDVTALSGKILRLTPDGSIPDDNPFEDSLVYSYGHRNPQGIGWDESGTLYASEFGQDTWDELNVIEPGGNYGWPEAEGIANFTDIIDPVQQWEPAEASPSGLAVTEEGIVIAALRGQRLIEVPLGDLSSSTVHLDGEHGRLRDVVIAPDDALWVLTNNTDGRGDPGPDDDRILRVAVD